MDIASRLRASALVDQLILDAHTFPGEAALELISLVPVSSNAGFPFQFEGLLGWSDPSAKGAAAGVGTVSIPGEARKSRWLLGQAPTWRCGLYKLRHRAGRMEIEQLFADTFEDQTGRAFALHYNRHTGRPTRMHLQVEEAVHLGRARLALARFRPWKRPG